MTSSSLQALDLESGYSTSDHSLLRDFYEPALSVSTRYDRAVGYFSSGLLALAPLAYETFVSGGGRMRLVCSPHLSPWDAQRLRVEEGASADRVEVASRLRALADTDDLADALTAVMSSLLASGILQMKFAHGPSGQLFHDKLGVFQDETGSRLSFVGSANETAAAWSGLQNHEQIEVFCDWQSPEQASRVKRHRRQFDEIWFDLARGLKVSTAEEAAAVVYDVRAPGAPEVALGRLRDMLSSRERDGGAKRGAAEPRPLRPHQTAVLMSWEQAGCRGLVSFATGGGKTLVGIEAVRRWTSAGRPALVLVPSTLLHRQWRDELSRELPDVPKVFAGAGHSKTLWGRNLRAASSAGSDMGPRLILSTYQTAATNDFRSRLRAGEHLLLVADEVHRMGAPDTRKLFDVAAGGRLGLSATPDRYGDVEGTQAIHDFFGNLLEPRFGIADAIKAKQLVPYDYYLETVDLTQEEQDGWDALSQALAQEIARNDGQMSDRAMRLARDRARILKSASAKSSLAAQVLSERFRDGDRWLIYCDTLSHLREVRAHLEGVDIPLYEYHSVNSHLGPEIFEHFSRGGALLAIKCLDEGVDLPFINKALILASTSNPREYIQRRGRVLRRAEDKYSATIVDAAVTDGGGGLLSLTEAGRAMEFAEQAQNRAGRFRLQTLLRQSRSANQWRRDDTAMEVDGGDDD